MLGPPRLARAALLAAALPWCAGCVEKAPAASPAPEVVWIPRALPASAAPPEEPEPPPKRREIATPAGRQPNHWWFLDVSRYDVSTRREWLRVDAATWEERFPNGAVMRYRILGRGEQNNRAGVVVRRMPDESVEVWIPDLGSEAWPQIRVVPDGDWHDLGPMHVIE